MRRLADVTHSPATPARHSIGKRRALLILAMGGGLALLLFAEEVHAAVVHLAALIQGLEADHPVWTVVVVLLFTALSAMLAFVSTAVIAPFMAATWGTITAGLLLWGGWLLGGFLAYWIGRKLGRPVIRRLASPELLARYEDYVSHRAAFGLVLLFQLALPSEVPGYLLGLVRYPLAKYLLSLALAELPYAIATVYLGAGVMERRVWLVVGVGLALVLFSTWTWRTLHQRLARHARPAPVAGRP